LVLERAQAEIEDATTALATATDTLSDLEAGTLDLSAVTINGDRYISDGTNLVLAP
jgi:hypothetical protein